MASKTLFCLAFWFLSCMSLWMITVGEERKSFGGLFRSDLFPTAIQSADSESDVLQKWFELENNTKAFAKQSIKKLLPFFLESAGSLNISANCRRDVLAIIIGLQNIKPWAFKFIDSSAKIIDGLLVGTLTNFGVYDECVNNEVRSTREGNKGKLLFTGQYCTINLRPPVPPKTHYTLHDVLPIMRDFSQRDTVNAELARYLHAFHFLTFRLGICTPSTCSLNDINNAAKTLGKALLLDAAASRCEVKEKNHFTPMNIVIMFLYSLAGTLLLIGSCIDIHAYYRKIVYSNKGIRLLIAFSLFTNYRKFVNTESSSGVLSCLNGMRFFCMSWIILGHTYIILNYQSLYAVTNVLEFAKDFAFQAIINSTIAVDTFFCIGGMLVCYLTMNHCYIKGHKFNVGLYIFHRIWRILPIYVFVIMTLFMVNLLGSGPSWYEMTSKFISDCQKNWWANLLFINNYYDPENMCLPQTWYIAADFQMYIGSLIILIPMIRWPYVGLLLSALGVVASILYSAIETYMKDYLPTILISHPDPTERHYHFSHFYIQPMVHASPYCIGLIAGCILAIKPKLKFPAKVQVVGWCLAFIANFSVLYGVFEWNKGAEPTLGETLLYAGLRTTAWSSGIAWMIVCCATGQGGIINYILSSKGFIPLARLTFVTYFIHPMIQLVRMGSMRYNMPSDHAFAVWLFFGHMCVTYMVSFAISMLIEAPFLAMEKIIFPRGEEKRDNVSFVKQNSVLNGTLKSDKNGDIAVIVHETKNTEATQDMNNKIDAETIDVINNKINAETIDVINNKIDAESIVDINNKMNAESIVNVNNKNCV